MRRGHLLWTPPLLLVSCPVRNLSTVISRTPCCCCCSVNPMTISSPAVGRRYNGPAGIIPKWKTTPYSHPQTDSDYFHSTHEYLCHNLKRYGTIITIITMYGHTHSRSSRHDLQLNLLVSIAFATNTWTLFGGDSLEKRLLLLRRLSDSITGRSNPWQLCRRQSHVMHWHFS